MEVNELFVHRMVFMIIAGILNGIWGFTVMYLLSVCIVNDHSRIVVLVLIAGLHEYISV